MTTIPEYFESRPERWITVYTREDESVVTAMTWEGWTKHADDKGIIIFGKPSDDFVDDPSKTVSPDIVFIPWSRIALIHMNQDEII